MIAQTKTETRRRFLAHFTGMGLGTTLLPGALWAQFQQASQAEVSLEMLRNALALSGLEFSEEDTQAMLEGVNTSLNQFLELREIEVPHNVSPPFHFSALVPGMNLNRTARPLRMSTPNVSRPGTAEELAFLPITDLGQLLRTRQVSSVELTEVFLDRIQRHNERLNCIVTVTDELAMTQARRADAEIAAGRYRGPLHGIPWGAKDILSTRGYRTTWGSPVYQDRVIDVDASIVEMLDEAGAVLVAKLATGELAGGDRWFNGQTKNPWNLEQGSSGSSAGSGSATGGGLVAFAIGSETSGSLLAPSARCGVTGLRPTLGRVSRHGAMVLSWTQDRLGPMCRSAEDCALVMSVISRPDSRDLSVADVPFNWDIDMDYRTLRVGYIRAAFDEIEDPAIRAQHQQTLETVRSLGVMLHEVTVPEFSANVSGYGVESATFHDPLLRSGLTSQMTRPERGTSMRRARVVPAVEYLHGQRVRMMMMMQLAAATAHVDVYLAPNAYDGAAGDGGTPAPPNASPQAGRTNAPADSLVAAPATPQEPDVTILRRHSTMANLATYPAISMPAGFRDDGTPTSIVLFGRPFAETEVLTLAKAYQDVTAFHKRHPQLEG